MRGAWQLSLCAVIAFVYFLVFVPSLAESWKSAWEPRGIVQAKLGLSHASGFCGGSAMGKLPKSMDVLYSLRNISMDRIGWRKIVFRASMLFEPDSASPQQIKPKPVVFGLHRRKDAAGNDFRPDTPNRKHDWLSKQDPLVCLSPPPRGSTWSQLVSAASGDDDTLSRRWLARADRDASEILEKCRLNNRARSKLLRILAQPHSDWMHECLFPTSVQQLFWSNGSSLPDKQSDSTQFIVYSLHSDVGPMPLQDYIFSGLSRGTEWRTLLGQVLLLVCLLAVPHADGQFINFDVRLRNFMWSGQHANQTRAVLIDEEALYMCQSVPECNRDLLERIVALVFTSWLTLEASLELWPQLSKIDQESMRDLVDERVTVEDLRKDHRLKKTLAGVLKTIHKADELTMDTKFRRRGVAEFEKSYAALGAFLDEFRSELLATCKICKSPSGTQNRTWHEFKGFFFYFAKLQRTLENSKFKNGLMYSRKGASVAREILFMLICEQFLHVLPDEVALPAKGFVQTLQAGWREHGVDLEPLKKGLDIECPGSMY